MLNWYLLLNIYHFVQHNQHQLNVIDLMMLKQEILYNDLQYVFDHVQKRMLLLKYLLHVVKQ